MGVPLWCSVGSIVISATSFSSFSREFYTFDQPVVYLVLFKWWVISYLVIRERLSDAVFYAYGVLSSRSTHYISSYTSSVSQCFITDFAATLGAAVTAWHTADSGDGRSISYSIPSLHSGWDAPAR